MNNIHQYWVYILGNCHALLYYEEFQYVEEAIAREKELKAFRREKKDIVIKRQNPDLKDLAIALGWI